MIPNRDCFYKQNGNFQKEWYHGGGKEVKMNANHKKIIVAGTVLILIVFLVAGIVIFAGGMKGEFHRDTMASDYFEVDRALSLKNQCDREKDGDACLKTARYYLEGRFVEENRKKAAYYLAKSCGYNNGDGCFHLGTFWYNDSESKGSSNNKKARSHFSKACSLGNNNGCMKVRNLEE